MQKLQKKCLKIKKKKEKLRGNRGDNMKNMQSKFEKTAVNVRKAGRKYTKSWKKI